MIGPQSQEEKYQKLVELLYNRCQELQAENERIVYRLVTVKKLVKRRVKEVGMLKRYLDKYNDDWRHVPVVAPHRTRRTELKRGPKPKQKGVDQKNGPGRAKKPRTTEKNQTKQKPAPTETTNNS